MQPQSNLLITHTHTQDEPYWDFQNVIRYAIGSVVMMGPQQYALLLHSL